MFEINCYSKWKQTPAKSIKKRNQKSKENVGKGLFQSKIKSR